SNEMLRCFAAVEFVQRGRMVRGLEIVGKGNALPLGLALTRTRLRLPPRSMTTS
ncbi:MAG: hypothetical protein RL509_1785, partial [Pseudomonadota bacterium]